MKIILFLLAILSFNPSLYAEIPTYLDYDLNLETNKWNLAKDCAQKMHQSIVDFCQQLKTSELDCKNPRNIFRANEHGEQLQLTVSLAHKDLPRRSTLAYLVISDKKQCIYNVRSLP